MMLLAQTSEGAPLFAIFVLVAIGLVILFSMGIFIATRYRKCPSDKILVVYGKVGGGKSAMCHHGGAAFIWPVFQDFQYLDLTPMPIDIALQGALSKQNIRVNTPSTFTVGIATEPGVMENAAERLLGLGMAQIKELAKDIIFGQMRVVIATMDIEEINSDRDKLIANISLGVEVELKKVGLRLINVNVQDITDESGYIDALGQEAASKAINEAKIKVAEANRDGEIGAASANKDERIQVANANAEATTGENVAAVEIANSVSERRSLEAEADRSATAAEKVAIARALEEAYTSEQKAETERANRDKATQYANVVVPAEIERERELVKADAEAEKIRKIEQGEADAVRARKQAEADGIRLVKDAEASGLKANLLAEADGAQAILKGKADGFRDLMVTCQGVDGARQMLLVELLPQLVTEQVKAISNLQIDKVTVWDSGQGSDGKNGTAGFLSGLAGALPPLHELTRSVGVDLPEYLGSVNESVEFDQAKADQATEEHLKKKVADWLKSRKEMLASFDQNNDQFIDDSEFEHAVQTCLDWAKLVRKESGQWHYAFGQDVKGPLAWEDLAECVQKGKTMFINTKGSSLWLPYEIVQLIS
ncbi:MAG: SPFH domain-containing protein [Verrucomicrobiota bacterium]